jgi:hypothetical protein
MPGEEKIESPEQIYESCVSRSVDPWNQSMQAKHLNHDISKDDTGYIYNRTGFNIIQRKNRTSKYQQVKINLPLQ